MSWQMIEILKKIENKILGQTETFPGVQPVDATWMGPPLFQKHILLLLNA